MSDTFSGGLCCCVDCLVARACAMLAAPPRITTGSDSPLTVRLEAVFGWLPEVWVELPAPIVNLRVVRGRLVADTADGVARLLPDPPR